MAEVRFRAAACQWSSYLREEEKLLRRWRWRSVSISRLRSENKSLCYSDTWAHQALIGCGMRARCVCVCVCACTMYVYVWKRWGGGGGQPWPWRRRWMKYCGWKRRAQVLERSSWEASVAKFTVIEGWEGGLHISLASRQWSESVCERASVCVCVYVPTSTLHQPVSQSVRHSVNAERHSDRTESPLEQKGTITCLSLFLIFRVTSASL